MHPIILFRKDNEHKEEILAAKKYFDVYFNRNDPNLKDKFIIPRYSSLPYHREFEEDIKFSNSKLINSTDQHNWIANYDYYEILKDYIPIPESWNEHEFPYSDYSGPFVVKGRTNSRKGSWNRSMFAPTRKDAIAIASELSMDSLISEQGIIYKKYIPLKTFEYGPGGMPISNEWRFFILGEEIIHFGYYWSFATEETKNKAKITDETLKLIKNVAEIASHYVNFYVVDVAETENGDWIVVELNCGTMSGLSCIDENEFYKNLKEKFHQGD